MYLVKELWIYPIKSCKGISLTTARLDSKGFAYDRRFMLTDANYRFLTQREHTSMALIETQLLEDCLRVAAPGMPPLVIPLCFDQTKNISVKIWKDDTIACLVSKEVDTWFTKYLGLETYLIYMPDHAERRVDPLYTIDNATMTFTDDFPILLISQASLDGLNRRLVEPVPMDRFRPNIVVSGTTAHAEDDWKRIMIGQVKFDVAKPSARCIMTTIDQATGTSRGNEPLKTLSTYRTKNSKVLFGQNIIHRQTGNITVGSILEVIY